MSKTFIRNIFFVFHFFGMAVYGLFDLYGGLQSTSLLLNTAEKLYLFCAVLFCSLVVALPSSAWLYSIRMDEKVVHWRGFMTGIGLALLFDQSSILLDMDFPYLLYALGILCFFCVFFVQMVYREQTSKGRLVFLALVFAVLMSKLDPSIEKKHVEDDDRPNVIVVTVDALNGAIFHQEDIQQLKSFDFLKKNGVSFSNMHAASDDPVRAYSSLLTSHISQMSSHASFADIFSQMGYETAAFLGAQYLVHDDIKQGFAAFDGSFSFFRGWSLSFWGTLLPLESSYRSSMETTGLMISWAQLQKKPFFAWVEFAELQGPYSPPVEWDGHFFSGDPYELHSTECMKSVDPIHLPRVEGRCSREWLLSQYKGELASLDRDVLEIVQWVQENPNTLLVFTGAYGIQQAQRIPWFGRDGLTVESTLVPTMIWFPSILASQKEVSQISSTMDLFPTIFDVLGIPLDEERTGTSLVDAIYYGEGKKQIEGVSSGGIEHHLKAKGTWKEIKIGKP